MLKTLARRIMTEHRRGVAVIVGGTALGQIITVAFSPLLSRIYSPAAFGLLATFTAIVSIGSILASARLEMAVLIVETEEEARRIVRAGLGLSLCVSVVLSVAVIPFSSVAAAWVHVPALKEWLWVAPWCCGFAASFIVLNQWAVRSSHFAIIGRRNTLRGLSTASTQTLTGLAGLQPGGIVLGLTLGHAIGAAWMMRGAFRPLDIIRGVFEMRDVLRERKWYCAKLTLSGLLNVAGTQVPVLLFATAYSQTAVGWLALTQRTLALPVGLIGTAVMQVYVSAMAASIRESGEFRTLFRRLSLQLSVVAVIGTTIVIVFAPILFGSVFGVPWQPAGDYARYLALGIGAQLVSVPLSQTMILAGRTALQVSWDVGRFVVVCGSVSLSITADAPPTTTVIVLGTTSFAAYTAQWMMNYYVASKAAQVTFAARV